jgi:hypothetical protein
MKKLLSIIMMACMIVTLPPIAGGGGALTQGVAYANNGSTGGGDGSAASTPVTPTITWTDTANTQDGSKSIKTASVMSESELTTAVSEVNNTVTNTTWVIKLDGDIAIGSTLNISKIVTLDLNGHVLMYENDTTTGSVIKVESSGNLTIADSRANDPRARHKFKVNDSGLWEIVDSNANVDGETYQTITGGVITGGTGNNYREGGGVYVFGTLNFFGGSVVGCSATKGGGVYMDGESLNLAGGKIIGCTATDDGGGVYFKKKSFDIASGEISNCSAKNGGAIFICDVEKPAGDTNTYKIDMSGGSISDCRASSSGGAIYIEAYDLKITGGEITNCKAKEGGAIFMKNQTTYSSKPKSCNFEISGGNITDCSATSGGDGIYAYHKSGSIKISGGKCDIQICVSNFDMSGGEVDNLFIEYATSENTQSISGGTVNNCTIYEKDAKVSGGTFYRRFENFGIISGGVFYGNVINYGTISGGTLYGSIENKTSNDHTGKFADGCFKVIYMNGNSQYAMQIVGRGSKASAPETPTNVGYKLSGWYTDEEFTNEFDFNTLITGETTLYAKWEVCTHEYSSWSDATCNVCGYERAIVYHSGGSSRQHPTVAETEHGTITLSSNGRTATITPDAGYEIASVTVNGEDKGAVSTLIGLRTGDKIAATFQKTKETLDTETKAAVASLSTMKARSSKTTKGNIKVVLNLSDKEKAMIANFKEQGYTVKYRFYRSTKKSSGYVERIEKDTDTFINTVGNKGTKYYYKVQVRVYDDSGTLVAKTALRNCKYACRKF